MGSALKNVAVVGTLAIAVGGGLWITQGDRQPVGHARGESVISDRIDELQTTRDRLWSEGMDCTPVTVSPHMRSLADLGVGLDDTIRIDDAEGNRVIRYEGPVWTGHGVSVPARIECVDAEGNIVVERSEGHVMPDATAPKFGEGWSVEAREPSGNVLTNVGDFFPPEPFIDRPDRPTELGDVGDHIAGTIGRLQADVEDIEEPDDRNLPEYEETP
jgi:hypothetical protein